MATRKTASLDGGLIAPKGAAVPAQVPVAARTIAEMPDTPRGTTDTIALTVRLDRELYLRLKSHGIGFRPRKTSQDIIVAAIRAYLAQAEGV